MRKYCRLWSVLILMGMIGVGSGCQNGRIDLLSGLQKQAPYTPMEGAFYINPEIDLSAMGRVALVELENLTDYPEVGEDLSESLYIALQKRQYFGLMTVAQNDPRWRSLQSPLDANYDADQLIEMQRVLQCDAILTGSVTQFKPYPHMNVGVRIRLIDLRSGELLWGAEQVWDCGDAHVKVGIKYYLQQEIGAEANPLQRNLISTSPKNFFKFVSYELAQTLES